MIQVHSPCVRCFLISEAILLRTSLGAFWIVELIAGMISSAEIGAEVPKMNKAVCSAFFRGHIGVDRKFNILDWEKESINGNVWLRLPKALLLRKFEIAKKGLSVIFFRGS